MSIRNAPHQRERHRGGPAAAVFEGVPTRTTEISDPDKIMAGSQPWPHVYKQFSSGRFRIRTTVTRTSQLELTRDRTATGVLINGDGLQGAVGFACFADDDVPRYADRAHREGELLVLGQRSEFHYVSYGPDEWTFVGVGAAKLAEWSTASGNEHLLDAAVGSRIGLRDQRARRALQSRLTAALHAFQQTRSAEAFEREVLWTIASCTTPSSTEPQCNLGTIAEHARRYVEIELAAGGSLLAAYARMGVAPRTVQKAFVLRFGVSPQQYRTMLQLNRARSLLARLRGRDPVRRAAVESGFTHFGRFARLYRDFFNELPSHTMKRAKDARARSPSAARAACEHLPRKLP